MRWRDGDAGFGLKIHDVEDVLHVLGVLGCEEWACGQELQELTAVERLFHGLQFITQRSF